MATVTAPIMTDATGQSIDSKLNSLLGKMDNLAAAFQPNASGIVYSNTTSGLTGDDVQEAIDEMAADVSEIKQSLSDLTPLEKTASGAIATFNDGSDLPMPSLKVAIEPQQDLHGYDAPWVGGSGKNKCDLSAFTHTGVVDDEGGVTTLNNRLFSVHIPVKSGTTYTLSLTGSKNGENIYANRIIYFDSNDTFIKRYTPPQIQTASFTTLSNAKYIQIDLRTASLLDIEITDISKIQLEEGDSATAYEPYSNICPISGWDECNVTVADDVDNPTVENVYTIDLDGTRYGGTLDVVSGLLTITDGYIASYNGETLPSTWISDRDIYAEGTTPTVGAEVVYKLANPQTVQLTPTQVNSLLGVNNIWANTGELELTYFVNNSLVYCIYDMINILTS